MRHAQEVLSLLSSYLYTCLVSSIIFMLYFQIPIFFLLFIVLDNSATSILSRIVFITIFLPCFLMRSLVVVESFLPFSLGAFPPTFSTDSKTKLSFKLCYH